MSFVVYRLITPSAHYLASSGISALRRAVAGEVPDNLAEIDDRQRRFSENSTDPFTPRLTEQQSQKGGSVENRQGHSRAASRRRSARKASREASRCSPSSWRGSAWAPPITA